MGSVFNIAFAGVVVISLCVLAFPFGNLASYPAMIAAFFGLLFFANPANAGLLRSLWLQMLLLAFGLIAMAFFATARSADERLYVIDFIALALTVPAAMLFSPLAGRKFMDWLVRLCLFGSVVGLAVVVWQGVVMGSNRPVGLENSPIHYASQALVVGFLPLMVYFVPGRRPSLIYCLAPIAGLSAALMTGTRSGLVVLATLVLVTLVFTAIRFRSNRRVMLTGTLALLAGSISVLAFFAVNNDFVFQRMAAAWEVVMGDPTADTSSAYRIEQYVSGLAAFMDAPWFGHGWRNQIEAALPFMSEFAQEGYRRQRWAYVHNELLSFMVGAGMAGFFAFWLIMLAPIVGAIRSPRDPLFMARAYGAAILVAGLAAAGLTEVLFMSELPKAFYCFLAAAIIAGCKDVPQVQKEEK